MPLVIAMIVLPIVVVWLVYEIAVSFYKVSENMHEAKKENEAFAEHEKKEEGNIGS
mgnify:CR=1 FL=1